MGDAYGKLILRLRETAKLCSVAHLLGWDQETMMPPKGGEGRAEELALISRLAHERFTDPQVGELLATCEADADLVDDPAIAANLRELRRDYDRARKLPAEFVAELNATSSRAVEAWKKARENSDFATFRPWLEKQFELNRRKSGYYGTPEGGEPYDALLEDYEPRTTARELEATFAPLRAELVPLLAELADVEQLPAEVLHTELPVEQQKLFNRDVLANLGFDVEAGRLDESTHPFSTGIGPGDTRITTRYSPTTFAEALGSTLHEAGHAMYEQGLPRDEHWGEPLGESLGLGIHESQSRMWENHVGRSRHFWEWAWPRAQKTFGDTLARFDVDHVYGAVNRVQPNLIRVESDEATYNLHIMLRFDLERAMLRGDLAIRDLPGVWNERVRKDLGLEVPDDARGCMQDIHWSMGSIGYFPTYTLGNLYAAQFWNAVRAELPDLDASIARGDFSLLLDWLRRNIHSRGRRTPAPELVAELTGKPLSHEPLMRHLRGKLAPLYGLDA